MPRIKGAITEEEKISIAKFIASALFTTITNANFDDDRITELIKEAHGYQNQSEIKRS